MSYSGNHNSCFSGIFLVSFRPFIWMSFMKEGPKHFHRKTILHDLTKIMFYPNPPFSKKFKICLYNPYSFCSNHLSSENSPKKKNVILKISVFIKQSILLRCGYQEKGEGSSQAISLFLHSATNPESQTQQVNSIQPSPKMGQVSNLSWLGTGVLVLCRALLQLQLSARITN